MWEVELERSFPGNLVNIDSLGHCIKHYSETTITDYGSSININLYTYGNL
jgi:hypothetical protein